MLGCFLEMHIEKRPLIGITLGDPCGIGPEVIVKALAQQRPYALCRPFVIGSASILERAMQFCRFSLPLRLIASPREVEGRLGTVEVLDLKNADPEACRPGFPSADGGRAAVESILKAIEYAMAGELHAMVTAPISKEAIQQAGFSYEGHTELLAERTGTKAYAMMLVSGRLRALHVSGHCSVKEACERVKRERVLEVIRLGQQALQGLGIQEPKIAVAGLNPHAGEGGLFGKEELDEIAPAIEAAISEGINASGPYPSDTVFYRARQGEFDAVIAMYHDQGHIPLKVFGFHRGVNVTVGLPILRTSPDHGTAFDIAGKGVADPGSFLHAIALAAKLARSKAQRTAIRRTVPSKPGYER